MRNIAFSIHSVSRRRREVDESREQNGHEIELRVCMDERQPRGRNLDEETRGLSNSRLNMTECPDTPDGKGTGLEHGSYGAST